MSNLIQHKEMAKEITKGVATIVKQGDKYIIIIPKKNHEDVKDFVKNQVVFKLFEFEID